MKDCARCCLVMFGVCRTTEGRAEIVDFQYSIMRRISEPKKALCDHTKQHRRMGRSRHVLLSKCCYPLQV
jgi:hypothetical protein